MDRSTTRGQPAPAIAPDAGDLPDPELRHQARLGATRALTANFPAVRTTGIYCRPICPARAPAEKRCVTTAAQRRPPAMAIAPACAVARSPHRGSPAWQGTATTVQRAAADPAGRTERGASWQTGSTPGIGERYLRKLFERKLG